MPTLIPVLAGTVFGQLTVIEETRLPDGRRAMLCRCGCGTTKSVATGSLFSGGAKSCGCGNMGAVVPPGTIFGRWTVIEEAPAAADRRAMLCECECGKRKIVRLHTLRQGLSKSCGCLRRSPDWRPPNFRDLTGERFGRLVVIRYAGSRTGNPRTNRRPGVFVDWLCVCDCGNEKVTTTSELRAGSTTSCGCARRVPRPDPHHLFRTLPPGRAARNRVLKGYQGGARTRELAWELTEEEFDGLIAQDCAYCGGAPSMVQKGTGARSGDFIHNGIDRKDNAIGYVTENVVPCCSVCNHAKMDMPYDDFITWIARLTRFWAGGEVKRLPPPTLLRRSA